MIEELHMLELSNKVIHLDELSFTELAELESQTQDQLRQLQRDQETMVPYYNGTYQLLLSRLAGLPAQAVERNEIQRELQVVHTVAQAWLQQHESIIREVQCNLRMINLRRGTSPHLLPQQATV